MTGIKGQTKSAVPMRAYTESYQQAVTSVSLLIKASHMTQYKIIVGRETQSSVLAGRSPEAQNVQSSTAHLRLYREK